MVHLCCPTSFMTMMTLAYCDSVEEGARLMYEDLKKALEPRIAIATIEKQNR